MKVTDAPLVRIRIRSTFDLCVLRAASIVYERFGKGLNI